MNSHTLFIYTTRCRSQTVTCRAYEVPLDECNHQNCKKDWILSWPLMQHILLHTGCLKKNIDNVFSYNSRKHCRIFI